MLEKTPKNFHKPKDSTHRIDPHHLGLLELLALDEIPAEGGGDFGHDWSGVPVHHVVLGFRHVPHETENGDPQRHGSLRAKNGLKVPF